MSSTSAQPKTIYKAILSGDFRPQDNSPHSAPHRPNWLTSDEAQTHLRCGAHHLGLLITQGVVRAYRSPAQGLLFRLDELDAAAAPLDAEEALRLLGEDHPSSNEASIMPSAPTGAPSDDTRPLKEAAVTLNMPYKTLLRLVAEGAVPAVDLNAHRGRRRPRYVVSIAAVRQHLKALSEKQAVQRRARPQAIELARMVQPRGGAR